ncbi:hypothetical protein AGLY_004985 [Aphis glycines]|uniref:Uncharacterized protein n=1 Tax=Aphis glycines TaxID=307491 RepID=A0A6G0TXV2_APHGL|nr:hypothetical protein AGLY_004985 [Aphis glycines]
MAVSVNEVGAKLLGLNKDKMVNSLNTYFMVDRLLRKNLDVISKKNDISLFSLTLIKIPLFKGHNLIQIDMNEEVNKHYSTFTCITLDFDRRNWIRFLIVLETIRTLNLNIYKTIIHSSGKLPNIFEFKSLKKKYSSEKHLSINSPVDIIRGIITFFELNTVQLLEPLHALEKICEWNDTASTDVNILMKVMMDSEFLISLPSIFCVNFGKKSTLTKRSNGSNHLAEVIVATIQSLRGNIIKGFRDNKIM